MAFSKDGQDQKTNILKAASRKIMSQEMLKCIMKTLIFIIQNSWSMWFFLTRCVCETQMPLIMANSKDGHKDIQISWYQWENLITRNVHVQYKTI